MATEDAKGNLHDERGRFARKGGGSTPYIDLLKLQGYDTSGMSEEWAENFAKDVGANKTVKIPLNFFAEKGLDSQGPTQIRKGIRSLHKKIELHRWKINNPEKVFSNWESFSSSRKESELRHWRREIAIFESQIAEREKVLKSKHKETAK